MSAGKAEGVSGRAMSLEATSETSDVSILVLLRVLYLCTFLFFTLNFGVTSRRLCCFSPCIGVSQQRGLGFLQTATLSVSCDARVRFRLRVSVGGEHGGEPLGACCRREGSSSRWVCAVCSRAHESTSSAVSGSSVVFASALSSIAMAMHCCLPNSWTTPLIIHRGSRLSSFSSDRGIRSHKVRWLDSATVHIAASSDTPLSRKVWMNMFV